MDKNTVIGSILIGLLVVGYFFISKPSDDEVKKNQIYYDSIQRVEYAKKLEAENKKTQSSVVKTDTTQTISDSLRSISLQNEYGRYASAAKGKVDYTTISNDLISVTFSNKGAYPVDVLLQKYTNSSKDILFFIIFTIQQTNCILSIV